MLGRRGIGRRMWVARGQVSGVVRMIHDRLKIAHVTAAVDRRGDGSRLKGRTKERV